MTNYECNKCFKHFKQKSHLEDHLHKKKRSCDKNKVNMSTNDNILSTQNPQNSTIFTENSTIFPQFLDLDKDHKNENITISSAINEDNINNKKYICSYCDKSYSRSDSLSRHVVQFCKNKKHIDNLEVIKSKINNTVIMSNERYEKLISDNIKLIEILEEYKSLIKDTSLLKHSIPSTINNNNTNNTNNTTNNGAINNGIVNSGSINSGNTINIVQFGKEDISKCNLIEMMNVYLKSTGGNIFANMLKYLNFNPKYPQNFNILMTDLARENVKIHNGKKFVTKKFKTVKNDILNVLSGHINHMCGNYIENPKIKKNKDILSKMNINNISVKLINNDDITSLLKGKNDNSDGETDEIDETDNESDIDDLNSEEERRLTHYESKRQGLQEISMNRLKDELYNNRDLVVNYHNTVVK